MIRFLMALTLMSGVAASDASTNDPAVDIESMAASSDIIAMVRVSSVTCLRDESKQIITRVSFDEGEIWKGDIKLDKLTVVQAGGTLGRQRTIATPSCTFTPGEWSVLFLERTSTGAAVVLGAGQGKLNIDHGNRSNALPAPPAEKDRSISIDVLKARIQAAHR